MKFAITYTDPETDERKTVIKEFHDSPNAVVHSPDGLFPDNTVNLTARGWAEDCAYGLADKNTDYVIKEIHA